MQTVIDPAPIAAQAGGFNLRDFLSALRRRRFAMSSLFIAIIATALTAAFVWPATYRSTGTILIEQQEVPTDFVRSAVTSYADQRVQVISQRVMTSANLMTIIDKYKLYPEARDRDTREALIDRLRNDIDLRMISADVVDPRQGKATKATIAFSVSYDSRSATLAARVANELTTLYLSENIETRRQLTANTADFLRDESERLGRSVAELESKVAEFKRANGERLPEYTQFNLQVYERGSQELRDLESRIRALDQQIQFLDGQLAQINPSASLYIQGGERVLSSQDRLKILRSQLASASSIYSADHPDVQRYKREIDGLERQLGSGVGTDSNETARRLADARTELNSARQRYSPDHPDVQRAERQVKGLEAQMHTAPPGTFRPLDDGADNPAYIQLRSQRSATESERNSLRSQIAQVRARMNDIENRQAAAPEVEREYSALARDLENERVKYAETRQKHMEAQLVQNLETDRKGERFTLIEPPLQPSQPVSPNRKLIVALGGALAIVLALALMAVLERIDTRVKDRNHLLRLVGVPTLAVIPFVFAGDDKRRRALRPTLITVSTLSGVAMALLTIHLFVRPLDVIGLIVMRRFGL